MERSRVRPRAPGLLFQDEQRESMASSGGFINRAQCKFLVFRNRAEQALVPGAIARQSQQETAGFVGGSNGALFKTLAATFHGIPVFGNDF